MKFKLIAGRYIDADNVSHDAGAIIKSDIRLDEKHLNKFIRLDDDTSAKGAAVQLTEFEKAVGSFDDLSPVIVPKGDGEFDVVDPRTGSFLAKTVTLTEACDTLLESLSPKEEGSDDEPVATDVARGRRARRRRS
jgi:hypothetical protein